MYSDSVHARFKELLSRIELNTTRISETSQRYYAIASFIKSALPGKEVRLVGSFQRKTKIRPIKDTDPLDIDAIVCFNDAYNYSINGSGITPSNAIEIVKRALASNKTYNTMKPKSDAPTVVLEYSDGFKMEIIPCFRELTGQFPIPTGPACYIIGSIYDCWIPADYDYDASLISGINQNELIKASLVPTIKLVKAFLRGKRIPLKSFHIEILTAMLIPTAILDWSRRNLNWGYHHLLAYFLSNAHTLLNTPVSLPGSYSPPVDSGNNAQFLQVIGQALNEFGNTAWEICNIENSNEACRLWRDFFGAPFPSQ